MTVHLNVIKYTFSCERMKMLWQDVPNTFTSIIIAVLFKKPQNNKNPQTTLEKCKLKNNPFSSLKSLKTPQSDKFAF